MKIFQRKLPNYVNRLNIWQEYAVRGLTSKLVLI